MIHLAIGVALFFALLIVSRAASRWLGAGENPQLSAGSKTDPKSRWIGKERVQIVEIADEARDIKSFTFQRADARPFPPFRAGQFLTFQIGEDPKQVRSYSIASASFSPAGSSQLRVTVAIKKLGDGFGSQWFHERKVGDWIWAYAPSGRFTDVSSGSETRVYVAGGIGITPIVSMIRTRLAQKQSGRMILIYGIRTPQDLAFDRILRELVENHKNFVYVSLFSDVAPRQRITLDIVRKNVSDLTQARFFICGPTAMNDSLTRDLLTAGVNEEFIHDEKFGSKTMLDPTKLAERDATVHVLTRVSTQSYLYSGREPLLDFLEDHGFEVPSACRSGVCGSCKCIVRGEYESLTDTGLTRAEKQLGYTLTCVTYPKAGARLEVVLPENT